MKSIVYDDFGGNDQLHLADVPIPDPEKGEVQIQAVYAGVNPVDWKIREGYLRKRLKTEFPVIPGWDVAGVVTKVGKGVTRFKEGDEVYAYCRKPLVKWGTFAEYVCVDAEYVASLPKYLGFNEAAAIPLVALTSWQALIDLAKVSKGESVLIHAGAGGVGSMAIQLAKWAGAKVYATASEHNHDYVKKLGADVAIDYHTMSTKDAMKKYEPQGFDMILDAVGEPVFEESLHCVKKGGWLVTICKLFIQDSVGQEYGIRTGFVFVRPDGKQLAEIAKLFDEGILKPPNLTEFPLEEAVKALDQMQTEHTRGKIVLKIK